MKREPFKARVPILEHFVYAFVVNRYGNGKPLIHLSKKHILGVIVELSAEKVGYQHALKRDRFDAKHFVEIRFNDRLKNHFLCREKLMLLSEYFEKQFRDIFLVEIEVMVSLGISDYEAVERFLEKYGIEEDDTVADTLRKRWRDRQKYMKKLIEKKLEDLYPQI